MRDGDGGCRGGTGDSGGSDASGGRADGIGGIGGIGDKGGGADDDADEIRGLIRGWAAISDKTPSEPCGHTAKLAPAIGSPRNPLWNPPSAVPIAGS